MKKSARLLAVIPYEELRFLFQREAHTFPDFSITVLTAGKSTALSSVRGALKASSYDILLAYTEAASLLRGQVDLPVVSLDISVYDLLTTLKIADGSHTPYCIAGSPALIAQIRSLCEALGKTVPLYELRGDQEARTLFLDISERDLSLVVTDTYSASFASELGIRTIQFSYGKETISGAMESCRTLLKSLKTSVRRSLPLSEALDHSDLSIAIYDTAGRCLYRNPSFLALEYEGLEEALAQRIESTSEDSELRFTMRKKCQIFRVVGIRPADTPDCVIFYIQQCINWSIPSAFLDIEIDKYAKADNGMRFIADDRTRELIRQVSTNSSAAFPVFVYGETGTGTENCVRFIHSVSSYRDAPFLRVNCELLNEKNWNATLNNPNSPLNDTGCTIYFKKLQRLSLPMQELLSFYIDDTKLLRRNHILSSALCDIQDMVKSGEFRHSLYCKLCGTAIHLPSLNECPDQIAVFAGIFLSQYNDVFGKQVMGFEPEALNLLRHYEWKINMDQLERAVRILVASATGPYITAGDVRWALVHREVLDMDSSWIDLTQPLEKIKECIVEKVYREENMDSTRTASRLGINRSTLWRIRKNMEGSA